MLLDSSQRTFRDDKKSINVATLTTGMNLLSFEGEEFTFSRVTKVKKIGQMEEEWVLLRVSDCATITCTLDTIIFTRDGNVAAEFVIPGDLVYIFDGKRIVQKLIDFKSVKERLTEVVEISTKPSMLFLGEQSGFLIGV